MNVLYLLGFIQSLFFSALIATKKSFKICDLILLLYIILLGGDLLIIYAVSTGFYTLHPNIVIFDFLYWTLLGPLLFIYIDLITSFRKKLQVKDLYHLIPTIIVLIGFSEFYFQNEISDFFKYKSDSILFRISYFVWMYNSPFYYILAIIKLRRYRKRTPDYFSNTKKVNLNWLYYLVHGFVFFLIFLIGTDLLNKFLGIKFPISSYSYTWIVLVGYIYGIGFYGYKQDGIFNDLDVERFNRANGLDSDGQTIPEPTMDIKKAAYIRSNISKEESASIYNRLIKVMKEKKPYLDSDLNLLKLAGLVSTTPHKLSYVINENSKDNFFEFINSYRVNEVKQYLSDPKFDKLKIIALAYDCGFNSKSSFYNIFKKATSLTPLQYRQQFNKQEVA